MALNVDRYLTETDHLMNCVKMRLCNVSSARSAFDAAAEMSFIHDALKRAKANADKLSSHFWIQDKRERAREKKAAKKGGTK